MEVILAGEVGEGGDNKVNKKFSVYFAGRGWGIKVAVF